MMEALDVMNGPQREAGRSNTERDTEPIRSQGKTETDKKSQKGHDVETDQTQGEQSRP
jgi:hypothetical protein